MSEWLQIFGWLAGTLTWLLTGLFLILGPIDWEFESLWPYVLARAAGAVVLVSLYTTEVYLLNHGYFQ